VAYASFRERTPLARQHGSNINAALSTTGTTTIVLPLCRCAFCLTTQPIINRITDQKSHELSNRVMMRQMSRKPGSHYGVAPRERPPAKAPKPMREVPRTPRGNPMAQAAVLAPHISRPPKPHAVGAPPRPRRPKLVRDVDGGSLLDLFQCFPDLPWPRPASRHPALGRDRARGRMARRALTRRLR
jgi:hypothetical protein